jgi:hypothetical protein
MNDVLGRDPLRRDRLDDGDRPFERHVVDDPALFRELPLDGLQECLPRIHTTTG